jgi:hypothetical protein
MAPPSFHGFLVRKSQRFRPRGRFEAVVCSVRVVVAVQIVRFVYCRRAKPSRLLKKDQCGTITFFNGLLDDYAGYSSAEVLDDLLGRDGTTQIEALVLIAVVLLEERKLCLGFHPLGEDLKP